MSVRVIPMSSGEYDVSIEVPSGVRSHRVIVGRQLLRDLAVSESDGARVVSAAIDYLNSEQELRDLGAFVSLDSYRGRRGFVEQLRRRIA